MAAALVVVVICGVASAQSAGAILGWAGNQPPPAPPYQGGEKKFGSSYQGGEKREKAIRHRFAERHMATLFQITIVGDGAVAKAAAAKAFAKAKELDDKLSDYKPDSELMKLCARAGQGPVPVSDELFEVLQHSQDVARKSGGAFDVTVGPVVRLWRLSKRTRELPKSGELQAALSKIGYMKIKLDPAKKTVELAEPGMRLDVGGIAKGYAGDVLIQVLKDAGCPCALVAAGGDIVAGDAPPGEAGWTVAIQPLAPGDHPKPVMLAHAGVSTCGDAEQFVEIGGVRYSHVINPKTGLGLTESVAVTVVAKKGVIADGLDTAAAVMGVEKGMKLLADEKVIRARFARKIGNRIEVEEYPRQ